jgi:hypothetical protein
VALPHLAPGAMVFLASLLAGILFWNSVSGRFEGDRLERSLRFSAGACYVHIHHWLYCLVLLALLHALQVGNGCLDGFLTGSVIQGLTYRDWHLLVYEKRKADIIYARWRSVRPPAAGLDA